MNTLRLALIAAACCLVLSGCRVSEHKNGNHDNVDIGTPFGGMHVNTNDGAPVAGLGISVYPGAVPNKDGDNDTNSADVNMSFGNFHLGVRAAGYMTSDSQDKVISFYKKDLAHYGDVIQCRGDEPVGEPTRTAEGLTCDTKHQNHISTGDHPAEFELRTGSPEHQHIVAIDKKDGKTKIGLVALDLPEHHDSNDSE
ncbi:MAG TPA: hypothetical protein VHY48_09130 [Acidobacteriaceae bacterium]|jgi:hypothetical protein|nr:hypothetical protein [Acidobacteriaceae bacterium]